MLAKQSRLVKEKDFQKTFKQGKSFYAKFLGVKAMANQSLANRYGIIVSTKVSKKSVERNKLKRQIRAVLKDFDQRLAGGHDLIIMVLPEALKQEFIVLKQELETILLKLRLFKQMK